MTLSRLITALIVTGLLAVQLAAVLYYLRHWGLRQMRLSTPSFNEGIYFKRYIPPSLRTRYDRERRRDSRRRALKAGALKAAVIGSIGAGVLAIVVYAVLKAWPNVNWVDLNESEAAALDYTNHDWVREPERTLPQIDGVLAPLRRTGVVLIEAPQGKQSEAGITAVAVAQWRRFLVRNAVPISHCRTALIERCAAGVKILMPGRWSVASIDNALAQGASLLLYGPPLQTVAESRSMRLHGLHFKPEGIPSLPHLALNGDRPLTLGFDAGLVLQIEPAFKGYSATSPDPQAIAASPTGYVGGDFYTRLYARRVGPGRLVWMDFSPNVSDHYPMLDERRLQALLASVFGYLLKRESVAWATWPGGRRFAGMLSVDAEDEFVRVSTITELARAEQAPITWFVLSNEAQRHRRELRELVDVGEIACHGDSHAPFPLVSARTQVVRIARCRKALQELVGVQVEAFRPPYEQYNDATIDAVANNGMSYYFAKGGGDRAVPVIERSRTTGKTLVSLPRIGSDDFELWSSRRLNVAASIEQADHELLWAHRLGGLLIFDFHTQFVTPERMRVIQHFIRRFKREDVYFTTAQELSRWWRLRDRLIRGDSISRGEACEFRPVLLHVNREGELVRLSAPREIAAALTAHGLAEHGLARDRRWAAAGDFCAHARTRQPAARLASSLLPQPPPPG